MSNPNSGGESKPTQKFEISLTRDDLIRPDSGTGQRASFARTELAINKEKLTTLPTTFGTRSDMGSRIASSLLDTDLSVYWRASLDIEAKGILQFAIFDEIVSKKGDLSPLANRMVEIVRTLRVLNSTTGKKTGQNEDETLDELDLTDLTSESVIDAVHSALLGFEDAGTIFSSVALTGDPGSEDRIQAQKKTLEKLLDGYTKFLASPGMKFETFLINTPLEKKGDSMEVAIANQNLLDLQSLRDIVTVIDNIHHASRSAGNFETIAGMVRDFTISPPGQFVAALDVLLEPGSSTARSFNESTVALGFGDSDFYEKRSNYKKRAVRNIPVGLPEVVGAAAHLESLFFDTEGVAPTEKDDQALALRSFIQSIRDRTGVVERPGVYPDYDRDTSEKIIMRYFKSFLVLRISSGRYGDFAATIKNSPAMQVGSTNVGFLEGQQHGINLVAACFDSIRDTYSQLAMLLEKAGAFSLDSQGRPLNPRSTARFIAYERIRAERLGQLPVKNQSMRGYYKQISMLHNHRAPQLLQPVVKRLGHVASPTVVSRGEGMIVMAGAEVFVASTFRNALETIQGCTLPDQRLYTPLLREVLKNADPGLPCMVYSVRPLPSTLSINPTGVGGSSRENYRPTFSLSEMSSESELLEGFDIGDGNLTNQQAYQCLASLITSNAEGFSLEHYKTRDEWMMQMPLTAAALAKLGVDVDALDVSKETARLDSSTHHYFRKVILAMSSRAIAYYSAPGEVTIYPDAHFVEVSVRNPNELTGEKPEVAYGKYPLLYDAYSVLPSINAAAQNYHTRTLGEILASRKMSFTADQSAIPLSVSLAEATFDLLEALASSSDETVRALTEQVLDAVGRRQSFAELFGADAVPFADRKEPAPPKVPTRGHGTKDTPHGSQKRGSGGGNSKQNQGGNAGKGKHQRGNNNKKGGRG